MGSLNCCGGGLPKFVRLRTKLTVSSCWADDATAEVIVADLLRFETVACLELLRRFFNSLLKSMGIKPTQPDFDFKIPRGASSAAAAGGGGAFDDADAKGKREN